MVRVSRRSDPEQLGFFDFIARRRQVISDRTWLGLAFIAAGFAVPSWWQLLPLLPGIALVVTGLRPAMRRQDPTNGERRPAAPW